MLDFKISFHNALQDQERLMTWPLVSVAQMAAGFILGRVPKGRAPRGSFGQYSRRQGRVLIPADMPHPASGLMFKTKDGRAAYPNYGEYKQAAGMGSAGKNFRKTGRLLRGMQIKVMSPTKVRVNFKGKNRKGLTNNKLAGFVQSQTSQSILGLSAAEEQQIARHVQSTFPPRYLDAQRLNDMSFKARRRLESAQKSLAKAKQLWIKAHMKVGG